MRKKIVAGNWKMNLLAGEATDLLQGIAASKAVDREVQLLVFPPAIYVQKLIEAKTGIEVGVQNFYPQEQGAFTGEISVSQVKDLGVNYALVGHSERRALFFESDELLKQKVNAALSHGITPVFCCGEPLEIRESNEQFSYVKSQLQNSLFHLNEGQIQKCIIAYEPVWAIGTGRTATSAQAEDMHREIRAWIGEQYGDKTAESISILYGGSCNASNAKELFACPNVDGGLIGGAALKAESFLQIASSF